MLIPTFLPLHRKGLSDDDVNKVSLTVVRPINTDQALRNNQIEVGNLGGVFKDVALEQGGLHEIFRDTDLIGNLSFSTTLFRDDFITQHRDAVADFTQGTARAIRWVQLHPRDEVIAKFEEIINGRGRNENTKYIQHWKGAGVPTPGGVISPNEFTLWVDEAVRLGQLKPGLDVNTLFSNEYNSYANGDVPAGRRRERQEHVVRAKGEYCRQG